MHKGGKPASSLGKISTLEKLEKLHPHVLLAYLFIIGVSLIFFFLMTALAFSTWQHPDAFPKSLPKSFIISTFVLVFSSYATHKTTVLFKQEHIHALQKSLIQALGLSLLFCFFQLIGWVELQNAGTYLSGTAVEGYLYVISGLHILHVVGGLVFLGLIYWKVQEIKDDPVKCLIFFTNPYQKSRLKIARLYWHFLDIVWLVLFLYFVLWI